MTPKEKAEELVTKMLKELFDLDLGVRCALVAVEEMINEYESNICYRGYDYDWELWDMQRDYWIEVKQEIEKL